MACHCWTLLSLLFMVVAYSSIIAPTRASPLLFGFEFINEYNEQYTIPLSEINLWVGKENHGIPVRAHFVGWQNPAALNSTFISLRETWGNHSIPMITWLPYPYDTWSSPTPNDDIANGKYKQYLLQFTQRLAMFLDGNDGTSDTADDRRVFLHFAPEPNGNWYPWSPRFTQVGMNVTQTPASFVRMWEYVIGTVRNLIPSKRQLQVVWNVNAGDAYENCHAEEFIPNASLVDWTAVTGYNWGTLIPNVGWITPQDLYGPMLRRIRAIRSDAPVFFFAASTDVHFNVNVAFKALWIDSLFNYAVEERIRALIYRNANEVDRVGNHSHFAVFWDQANPNRVEGTLNYTSCLSKRNFTTFIELQSRLRNTSNVILASPSTPLLIPDYAFFGVDPPCECDTPQVRAALTRFYLATGGLDWKNASGWTSFDPVCSWYGIRCQGAELTEIILAANNLKGFLPADLPNIASIQLLNLAFNMLNGPLPRQWSAMAQLVELRLYGNQLSGTLPPEWNAMTKLKWLHLGSNSLNGSLPAQWSGMASITEVHVGENHISGTLPPEWRFMSQVRIIYLSGNQLNGSLPPEWSTMPQLVELNLSGNSLTGSLPPEWSKMVQIQVMYLHSNQLTGTLPPEWSAMPKIEQLQITMNHISGPLPPEWRGMQVQQLILNWNSLGGHQLTGSLPPQWSAMPKLVRLEVGHNQLTGSLPPEWGAMAQIQTLRLSGNQLNGSLPPQWNNMTQLSALYLDGNALSGPLALCGLPRWKMSFMDCSFDFSDNMFSGRLQLPCLSIDPCSDKYRARLDNLVLKGNHLCGVCSIQCQCSKTENATIESPDLAVVRAPSSDECCSTCVRFPRCVAAVYHRDNNYCELKNMTSPTVAMPNAIVLVPP